MANEVTIPILPCRDIDESIQFYEALGFVRAYRQTRPNPYAVVAREDIQIHLFDPAHDVDDMDEFDPAGSYGNVIVAVPDLDGLYASFAAGLRGAYGKLPSAGIPRILRPRKRFGTVRGFSVVDPGGNWLRFGRLGDTEEEANEDRSTGLARVIENAARHGDARGNDQAALEALDRGLERFRDAPNLERARALLYRAELAVRLGDRALATASLAEARALELTTSERATVADELAHAAEVVRGLDPST